MDRAQGLLESLMPNFSAGIEQLSSSLWQQMTPHDSPAVAEPQQLDLRSPYPQADGDRAQLGASAGRSLGRSLWAETPDAGLCDHGNMGCAASVSKVLQENGIAYADSASVRELRDQLTGHGWQQLEGLQAAQEGDVIYADDGTNQHVGIVGRNAQGELVIYNNWSTDGTWHEDRPEECSIITDYAPDQVHVLRQP